MATVPQRGVVNEFDAERGLGTITAEDGGEVPFHCTRLADGTRNVAVGTPVVYLLAAGSLGRWEATGIVKL